MSISSWKKFFDSNVVVSYATTLFPCSTPKSFWCSPKGTEIEEPNMKLHLLVRFIAALNFGLFTLFTYYYPAYALLRRSGLVGAVLLWLGVSSVGLILYLVNDVFRIRRQPQHLREKYHFRVDLIFSLAWFGVVVCAILTHLPTVILCLG